MLSQWCSSVLRSKVEPINEVAQMIRSHFDGIIAWTQTRQTNGFLEALNGLFQAAKRKARGVQAVQHHADSAVSHRRETRLPEDQWTRSVTHSFFKRA